MGKEKAAALTEDTETRQKEQLEAEAATALADYEAYVKEEEKKAALAAPKAQSCEVCGTAYTGDDEYKQHLEYRVHDGYQQIKDKLEELKSRKEERDKARREEGAAERKKKMEAEIEKQEKRAAKKDKEKNGADSDDKEKDRRKDRSTDRDRDRRDTADRKKKDSRSRGGAKDK